MTPSVENALPVPSAAGASPPAAPAPDAPPLGLVPRPPEVEAAEAAEASAWAEVLAGWDDDARHRAYLARFRDLDGLAAAGRRYRDALAARPHDPVAARWRDEVLRRAVAHGLASLPRAAPPDGRARLWVRVAAGAVIGALLLAAALLASRLLPFLSGGAR